jgi:hypothetical protein
MWGVIPCVNAVNLGITCESGVCEQRHGVFLTISKETM